MAKQAPLPINTSQQSQQHRNVQERLPLDPIGAQRGHVQQPPILQTTAQTQVLAPVVQQPPLPTQLSLGIQGGAATTMQEQAASGALAPLSSRVTTHQPQLDVDSRAQVRGNKQPALPQGQMWNVHQLPLMLPKQRKPRSVAVTPKKPAVTFVVTSDEPDAVAIVGMIRAQSIRDIEILFIDNASSYNYVKMVSSIADSRIFVFKRSRKLSLENLRQFARQQATGNKILLTSEYPHFIGIAVDGLPDNDQRRCTLL